MSFELDSFLSTYQTRTDQQLQQTLLLPNSISDSLSDAMRYATLNGGKRFRPILVYATVIALGGDLEAADIAAIAIELVHSYSLVHDDLPSMDDDKLRRGQATCHIAFDEATAILAGDALQTLAFEVIAESSRLSATQRLQLISTLAKACGTEGMAAGQALDLAAEGKSLTIEALEAIHEHKTGKLIRASVQMGAIIANCNAPELIDPLDNYAHCLGLAFQIQDDILDVIGNTDTLGKDQGKDQVHNKATYPSLLGLEAARSKALDLHKSGMNSLACLDTHLNASVNANATALRALSKYVITRQF